MSRYSFLSTSFCSLLSFRLYVILCYQMVTVVVGWHIYQITGSKLALGLIGLAEVLPYFASALFAGYAVDHFSKIKLGLASCVMLIVTCLMLFASVKYGDQLGAWRLWLIYGAMAISGVARSILAPVYITLTVKLTDRHDYLAATAFATSAFQMAKVTGPVIGGVLIALSGLSLAYLMALCCALIGMLGLLVLMALCPQALTEEDAPEIKHSARSMLDSIYQGWSFVKSNQVLLPAMALDMFAVLFGGAMALLPVFVEEVLHSGPESLGLLRASPAVAALFMGLVLSRFPIRRYAGQILLCVVVGFGCSMILFAMSTTMWLSITALALSGMFDCVSMVLRVSVFQLTTPDDMRGRVSSISGLFVGSSNELGAFESGAAAAVLGLVPSIIFGACMTFVAVGVIALKSPELRRLNMKDLM